MRVHNFLTEPDRDMLIEKENISHGRITLTVVKNLYIVRGYAHTRAQLFKGAR